ncbi:unnamed protein product [Brassica rapa subsp. narinosa]
MIYPFYSCVTNNGPYYNYILADEDGYKMEMNTYENYKNFRGLEKEEGRWVEIFVVDVERTYPCFKTTRSPFRLIASRLTQVRIIEPLNNRLFFDFKSIHAIPRMHWRDLKYPIDTMGVVFNTEANLDAPSEPRMEFYIRDNIRKETPIIPAIWVWIASGDDLDDAHPAPTPTRYPRSSYPSPTTGRGR